MFKKYHFNPKWFILQQQNIQINCNFRLKVCNNESKCPKINRYTNIWVSQRGAVAKTNQAAWLRVSGGCCRLTLVLGWVSTRGAQKPCHTYTLLCNNNYYTHIILCKIQLYNEWNTERRGFTLFNVCKT